MFRLMLTILLALALTGCAHIIKSPSEYSANACLAQGKRYFEEGYYKKAMRQLLPLACDGVAEAQYAIGYLYYYGLGVTQDTEVGAFWITRSANKGYPPAKRALHSIDNQKENELHAREQLLRPHERLKENTRL